MAGDLLSSYNEWMKQRFARIGTGSVFAFALLFSPLSFASAQGSPSGAMIVSPAKHEITLSRGETRTVVVTLSNGTPYPLTVVPSYEDVVPKTQSVPEDDPIALSPAGTSDRSLRDFVGVPRSFNILTGKSVEVPVTVTIPKSTEAGGRYGSIVWTFRISAGKGIDVPANVAVESRIASILYVSVEGNAKKEGALAAFSLVGDSSFAPRPSAEHPIRLAVSFENRGDVHLNPYGRITLTGLFGGTHVALIDPWAVLPGASRTREIDVHEELFPGRYRALLELNRGYDDIVDEREIAIWVLPTPLSGVLTLLALLLVALLIRRSLALSRHYVS